MARSHDHARVFNGLVRDRTRPPTRRDSPAGTPPSNIAGVKNAEVLPESASDTEDIFNVTDPESAVPAVVSQPSVSESAEQQDMNVEEEALVQPKATYINSADVSMQGTIVPGILPGSNRDGEVLKAQLVHNNSHEGHQITSVEQLPIKAQHPGSYQDHDERQDPIARQQSVEDQQCIEDDCAIEEVHPVEAKQSVASGPPAGTVHDMPSTSVDQNIEHPPIPADTSLPTPIGAQQPLRGVNRSAPPRVTKIKRKSLQSGSTARPSNSSSYTAAQLYQLAEYMKEQEQLQEKQDWVKSLAEKQEALDKANRHKSKLQVECVQLKASLAKHSQLFERYKRLAIFNNGLGQDLQNLHEIKAAYNEEIRGLKSQLLADRGVVTSIPQQIGRVSELKGKIFRLAKEQQMTIKNLKGDKSDLEKRLREASKSLAQEKSRQDAFDERLQSFQTARNSTEEMLNGCVSKINDRLSEFTAFIEQSTSSSKASQDLLELMKKESTVILEQIRSSGTNMEVMKTSVENLSLG